MGGSDVAPASTHPLEASQDTVVFVADESCCSADEHPKSQSNPPKDMRSASPKGPDRVAMGGS
jgi:hypothetical protein